MGEIRQYLIRVTATAIICGIVTAITGKKGSIPVMIRVMSALLLATVLIAPIVKLRLPEFSDLRDQLRIEGDAFVEEGMLSSREALAAIIKRETEAYILDKAASVGADITVSVSLTEDTLPAPKSVQIIGQVSPYGKTWLQQKISEELGIPLEEQKWIGAS